MSAARPSSRRKKTTTHTLVHKKQHSEPITMLTAYTAARRLLEDVLALQEAGCFEAATVATALGVRLAYPDPIAAVETVTTFSAKRTLKDRTLHLARRRTSVLPSLRNGLRPVIRASWSALPPRVSAWRRTLMPS